MDYDKMKQEEFDEILGEIVEANLNKPMTTDQAIERHQCSQCRSGDPCEMDCVESSTCSLICKHCGERNWWTGDLPWHRPWVFRCVGCGKLQEWRKK